MSFWGEMKQFYYVCKVGVHCTYLFKVFFVKSILSRIFFMKNDWLNNIFKLIFNRDLFLFSNFLGRHRHLHHSFKEIS